MFKNMKLAVKLSLGIGSPLIMMVGVVVAIYFVVGSVNGKARTAKDESVVYAGVAQQMKMDVVQIQQWLTDISATRARDGLNDGFDEAEKSKDSFIAGLVKFREMYVNKNDNEGLAMLVEIDAAMASYYSEGKKMAQAYIVGGSADGNKLMENFDNAAASLAAKLGPFIEQQTDRLDVAMASIISSVGRLRMIIVIASATAIIISIVIAISITRSITKPLNKVIYRLDGAATQLGSASSKISSSSQALAQGSSEQASSLEETSSTMEEMSTMTKQNADNAQEAATMVEKCNDSAEKGKLAVADMCGSIDKMNSASMEIIDSMSSSIHEINASSNEIAEITMTIDGIAFQTNLLALNAAVEAARAGEHGKGFAVVAEEVRNLAQRSASAAKDTAILIKDCVDKANKGTELTNKCRNTLEVIVDDVKKSTDNTNTALQEIVGSIDKVSTLAKEISVASCEQSDGVNSVNSSVQQMDTVTQQNAATAEEVATTSEEMSAQSQTLMEQVFVLMSQVEGKNDKLSGTCSNSNELAYSQDEWSEQATGEGDSAYYLDERNGSNRSNVASVSKTSEEIIPM